MEVIPAIDLMHGCVVRLVEGDPKTAKAYNFLGDPVDVARRWKEQGANRLHIVDLDAALGLGENREAVFRITNSVGLPLQFGGGVRSFDIAGALLEKKVQRVILGTLAFDAPSELTRLIQTYGDDRVVVALDHRDGTIVVNGWRASTGLEIEEALLSFLDLKIKRFLVTSATKDGTLSGPDLHTLEKLCAHDQASVVTAGGVGSLSDLAAVKQTGVEGVVVGKALYEGMFTLREALETVRRS